MAGIRTILLHVDATSASIGRLAVAQALAERHGAQLAALFGVRPDAGEAGLAFSAAAALRAIEEGRFDRHTPERARLRQKLSEQGSGSTWCEVVGDTLAHAFVAEAAYADLLVLGRPADEETLGAAPAGFAESVILDSGTPAIVLPPGHRPKTLGDRVLVAWNGSVPSARAMRAALPIMERAKEVQVVSWAAAPPAGPCSGVDVGAWLQRHGIVAEVHCRAPSSHVAEELAALATRLQADLVVMGCYGHTRLRERVFGGVTRSSLAALQLPILTAH